eukprot:751172-Hanusia_phi.AAC.17
MDIDFFNDSIFSGGSFVQASMGIEHPVQLILTVSTPGATKKTMVLRQAGQVTCILNRIPSSSGVSLNVPECMFIFLDVFEVR